MAEKTGTVYHLEKADKAEQFEKAVTAIKGVTFAKVDTAKMTFEYAIDEWSSDYDVFTQIMEIIDDYGVAFDFSYAEKKHNSIKQFEITGNEEMESEFLAHGLESENLSEIEEQSDAPTKKKKATNEVVERCIEIGAAIAFYVVSFFVKDLVLFATYALSFALAGYEVLYKAIIKIVKKREIISEELLITLALIVGVITGYTSQAVGACLVWTVGDFVVNVINQKIQKGKVCYFAPEKLTLLTDDEREEEVLLSQVKTGDKVIYRANEICIIDGTICQEEADVVCSNGKKVTLSQGEKIYAGDKVLQETFVTALYEETQNKNYEYNQKAKKALEKQSALEQKLNAKKKIYLPVYFGVCLLIVFVAAIFDITYKVGLYRWGYRACIALAVCGFSNTLGSLALSIYRAIANGKNQKVLTGGYDFSDKMNNITECAIDCEYALFENGEIKQNVRGAIRELKDCNIKKISLITSLSEEDAEKICKEYKIHEFYANRSEEQKREIFEKLKGEGVLCVCDNDVQNEKGVSISMYAENNGYKGDACILDGEIKNLPFIIKLAKRTQKIKKANFTLNICVKVIIIALALSGILGLLWAMLINFAVDVIGFILALSNGSEVI